MPCVGVCERDLLCGDLALHCFYCALALSSSLGQLITDCRLSISVVGKVV